MSGILKLDCELERRLGIALPMVTFLKEPVSVATHPLSPVTAHDGPVYRLAHTQRQVFILMTLVPPFSHGILFWQEARAGGECRRGRIVRVTGRMTAAAMRRKTMRQRRRKIHLRIPHNCRSLDFVFRPEVESGGKELWPNARFELLKVEVHRDRGSCPTGVDSPGGGKEANMSESEPEPRRTVAESELAVYN